MSPGHSVTAGPQRSPACRSPWQPEGESCSPDRNPFPSTPQDTPLDTGAPFCGKFDRYLIMFDRVC